MTAHSQLKFNIYSAADLRNLGEIITATRPGDNVLFFKIPSLDADFKTAADAVPRTEDGLNAFNAEHPDAFLFAIHHPAGTTSSIDFTLPASIPGTAINAVLADIRRGEQRHHDMNVRTAHCSIQGFNIVPGIPKGFVATDCMNTVLHLAHYHP